MRGLFSSKLFAIAERLIWDEKLLLLVRRDLRSVRLGLAAEINVSIRKAEEKLANSSGLPSNS